MQKTCFVIMGYGVKKGLDLDLTYEKIIKPCIKKNKLSPYKLCDIDECNAYRGDEICTTQSIDINIVSCINGADIVIADISSMSPNAIYELGVRHALKPRVTIVMCAKKQNKTFRFFDLNFVPIIFYEHLGKVISTSEVAKTKKRLNKFILSALKDRKECADSPIQKNLQNENIIYNKSIYNQKNNQSVYSLYLLGIKELNDCHYIEASKLLLELYNVDPCEENFLLYVLAKYKAAESHNSIDDLLACVELLENFKKNNTPESEDFYGRMGAIYLRLFNETNIDDYYFKSLEGYRLGSHYSKTNLYCPRNYCAILLKIYKVTKNINIIKEYYYTAVHYAKIFSQFKLDIPNDLNKEQIVYYKYNQLDLLSIINNNYTIDSKSLKKISINKRLTKRQKSTLCNGIKDFKNDLKNINQIINLD